MASKSWAMANYSHVPVLNEDHFEIWKHCMLTHFSSIDEILHDIVFEGPCIPMKANPDAVTNKENPTIKKAKEEWTDEEKKWVGYDGRARNIILSTLDLSTHNQIVSGGTAKELCDAIEGYVNGDKVSKENKRFVVQRKFNCFMRKDSETLRQTYDRFCAVVNSCKSLGTTFTNKEVNSQFLDALGSRYVHKASHLEDSGFLDTWPLRSLYANLKVYELKLDRIDETEGKGKLVSYVAQKEPAPAKTSDKVSTSSLLISDVEVRETKMMGDTPLIIVQFQTQQVRCVRDRLGAIVEGSQDTINTVHYLWAIAQMDVEEVGEGALYPIWRLRDMQQVGIRALI